MTSDTNITSTQVQMRLAIQDEKFNSVLTKIDATNQRIDDFIGEMRDQNKMRAKEIAEIRNDIKEIYKTTDAKIESIRQSVQSIQDSGRTQTLVTFLGIAAMVVAVLLK